MRNVFDQVPAVLLGMMGVDEEYQGAGLGADLLCDAILNVSKIANLAGARTLVVDPADEDAAGFSMKGAAIHGIEQRSHKNSVLIIGARPLPASK